MPRPFGRQEPEPGPGQTRVILTERALSGYGVYVMSRGRDWRVGQTKMWRSRALGVRHRLREERADGIWLLDVFDSRNEAQFSETALAWTFGVPYVAFRAQSPSVLSQAQLDRVWAAVDSRTGALRMLAAYGQVPGEPLLKRGCVVPGIELTVHESNLLPEAYMRGVECSNRTGSRDG